MPKFINLMSLHQITIGESLQVSHDKDEEDARLEKKRREFEISLSRSLSNHKVPFQFLECLQDQLKKYCGDSEVVKRMKLSRYKGEVILRHGVGKTYQDETVGLLQKCDAFSVPFNELEVNKVSELEILMKIAMKDHGEQLRHYRTLYLYSAAASNIVEALLSQFDSDGVDYMKKLLSTMTDGCNTMQGGKTGMKKQLVMTTTYAMH